MTISDRRRATMAYAELPIISVALADLQLDLDN
jgi:hypothetical protein